MSISNLLTSKLKDASLVTDKALVGADWLSASESGKIFDVTNPATGDVIATLPDLGKAEVTRAIEAAHKAQKAWAKKTGKERAGVLRKLFDLMVANADDLATILTMEMGKPWPEARGEILYGASYVEWFGEEAKRVYGDTIPGHQPDKRIMVIKQPIGVVGAITPWNFPNAMLARKMAPAVAVGCAMVSKPAAQTPLSALALAILAERAGLPAGIFSVVTSTDAAMVGKEMCENDKVRKLTFTGSTNVGKILMRQGADQIMKLGLELGGNAPFIVFDDADLDAAVDGLMAAKFRNGGQTCVCPNRVYVQAGVHDVFVDKLAARVAALRVGPAGDETSQIGPMINARAVDKIDRHVRDAVEKGARVVVGGERVRADLGPHYYAPTVLAGATPAMALADEETFGPVAPIFRFTHEDEVIRDANDTPFGLAAYFYSNDVRRIWRVAQALETGIVGINEGALASEAAPFGGVKESGYGREGSRHGLDDYMHTKYLCQGQLG